MNSIFHDDASPQQRRAAALDRLMAMCPAPYRVIARPYAESALQRASDDEIDSLLTDVSAVETFAKRGDMASIRAIAQKYGATPAQMAAFDASATSAEDQFAGVLPNWQT